MKTNKKEISMFFATDDNYVMFLSVALQSIIDNANKKFKYHVYVLYTSLNKKSVNSILKMEDNNFVIEFVNVKEKMATISNKLFTRDYYTNTTYYRFLIADLFPNINKALYLDSDIVVKGDISKLYNTNIFANYVGAINEEVMYINKEFYNYTNIVLDVKTERYFNAGILIMNLKEFRKNHIFEKFLQLINEKHFKVAQDQDYLNVLCKDHVYYLPLGWNKTPIENTTFNNATLKLVHYKINWKPWHYDNVLYGELFWEYASKTPFYNDILTLKNNYNEEDKNKDSLAYYNLVELAKNEIIRAMKDNYYEKQERQYINVRESL